MKHTTNVSCPHCKKGKRIVFDLGVSGKADEQFIRCAGCKRTFSVRAEQAVTVTTFKLVEAEKVQNAKRGPGRPIVEKPAPSKKKAAKKSAPKAAKEKKAAQKLEAKN